MIKLQPSFSQITLPFDNLVSYKRLYIDYQELFDPMKRIPNEKCYTEFQTPTFSDNIFKMNLAILCKEGQYQETIFRVPSLSSFLGANFLAGDDFSKGFSLCASKDFLFSDHVTSFYKSKDRRSLCSDTKRDPMASYPQVIIFFLIMI